MAKPRPVPPPPTADAPPPEPTAAQLRAQRHQTYLRLQPLEAHQKELLRALKEEAANAYRVDELSAALATTTNEAKALRADIASLDASIKAIAARELAAAEAGLRTEAAPLYERYFAELERLAVITQEMLEFEMRACAALGSETAALARFPCRRFIGVALPDVIRDWLAWHRRDLAPPAPFRPQPVRTDRPPNREAYAEPRAPSSAATSPLHATIAPAVPLRIDSEPLRPGHVRVRCLVSGWPPPGVYPLARRGEVFQIPESLALQAAGNSAVEIIP
jgi:hypothetical protein